jgi:hypothetical protein
MTFGAPENHKYSSSYNEKQIKANYNESYGNVPDSRQLIFKKFETFILYSSSDAGAF